MVVPVFQKIWLAENGDDFGDVRVSGLGVFESFL
jgi:hypothetical protein